MQDPSGQQGNAQVSPGWPNPGPEGSQKIHEISNHLHGITLAPTTPCKLPMGEEGATMGSAESPLNVQTAQQLSNVLATWASPCASFSQKK